MLDCEDILFDAVVRALEEQFPGIAVYAEEVDSPASFPAVTFTESSNTCYYEMQTGDNVEHYANLMFSVNAYSARQVGAREESKQIMDIIDTVMRSYGFLRISCRPMANYQRSIARWVARYTGVLSEDGLVYKTIY